MTSVAQGIWGIAPIRNGIEECVRYTSPQGKEAALPLVYLKGKRKMPSPEGVGDCPWFITIGILLLIAIILIPVIVDGCF